MNTSSFTIQSWSQDISIDPTLIQARFDGLNHVITIPIHFVFRSPSSDYHIEINAISAELFLQNALLSKTTEFPGFHIDCIKEKEEKKDNHSFQFLLSEQALHFIEKNRKGDIQFRIELKAIEQHKTIHDIPVSGNRIQIKSLRGPLRMQAQINLDIPQSQWVKSILAGLQYKSLQLIEVPLDHKTLKAAYSNVQSEFEKAHSHFKNQNYDECVGSCRKAMEKLTENLKNYKSKIGSKSNYEWLEKINSHTVTWIDEMNKTNSAITSKPHHSGDHTFERQEAESIYLITLGLLNHIGHIK